MNEQEQQLAKRIQSVSEKSRSSFNCNSILARVAKAHAIDMATRGYFSSINPEGVGPNSRVRQAGYHLPDYYNATPTGNNIESIAAGYASADGVWEALAHNSQILGGEQFWAAQTEFGIAYYHDPNSPFADYWVILTAPPSR
ncbi:MAG: CAP domain-containing protein [Caldilineaceae bacterium]